MIQPRIVTLPEALFDEDAPDPDDDAPDPDDDAPTVTVSASPRAPAAPSAEFLSLVGETGKKLERRRGKPKTIGAAVFNRALAEVDEMLRSGEWEGATVRHLVALYDRLHERCYGVAPAELGPAERFNATMLAGNMLKREFRDDLVAMVEYMLWAWERELDRERWRRENGKDGGRIGVRLMFGGHLLTDHRLYLARRGRLA